MDYSTYDSAPMLFDIMGFGKRPDEPVPMADPAALGATFRAPLMLLADGLGAQIDEFEHHREVALADRPSMSPPAASNPGRCPRSGSASVRSSAAAGH